MNLSFHLTSFVFFKFDAAHRMKIDQVRWFHYISRPLTVSVVLSGHFAKFNSKL